MEWQPIDSLEGCAPVMVGCPATGWEVGKVSTAFKDATGVWRVLYSEGGMQPLPFIPTHWQPRPTPPKPAKSERDE